jgi:DNA polymerase IV
MRIACLYLPGFAVQMERRTNPALCGVPLIIGGYHHEMGRVRGVSSEAAGFGVAPGMLLRQAYRLCPSGTFLPYREEGYREAFSSVVFEVAQLCPLVEPAPPAHILLGLRYERDERRFVADVIAAVRRQPGFYVSCGIASSRFAARVAAEDAALLQTLVVEVGAEGEFLGGLPVERLPLGDAVLRRLRLLGIVQAADLLRLPAGALEAQFGREAQAILGVIRGEDDREVEQWKGLREVVRARNFDVPVADGDELLEAARTLVAALCRELQSRWQCCRCLTVVLSLENGESREEELYFKEPASLVAVLSRRLLPHIDRLVGVVPVEALRLTASDLCAGRGTQSSFLDGLPRSTAQFNEALGVLQQRYGKDVVKRVVKRHGGRLPEERFSFVPCEVEER